MAKPEKEEKIEETTEEVATPAKKALTFDFAVNTVKLNRAKAHVAQLAALNKTPVPTGNAYVEAVRERYELIGGLMRGTELANRKGGKPKGHTVNLADNDKD